MIKFLKRKYYSKKLKEVQDEFNKLNEKTQSCTVEEMEDRDYIFSSMYGDLTKRRNAIKIKLNSL